jgi:hypothetical protein
VADLVLDRVPVPEGGRELGLGYQYGSTSGSFAPQAQVTVSSAPATIRLQD